jgi:hypothetical protein
MIFLLSLGIVVPAVSSSQSVGELQLGARIEVTPTLGGKSTGAFSSFANDSLSFVLNDATARHVVLPLRQIKSVRVSKGRSHSTGAVRGALIGTLAGLASGAIIGAATTPKPRGNCVLDCSRSESMVFAGMFYGGLGLVGGTIVGAIVSRESWDAVDLRRMR